MAKPQKSEVIKPLIRVGSEKHALETIFDGDPKKIPTLKAIGYARLKEGNNWVSYVIEFKGTEILSIEIDEPNMRGIAEEASKINFVNCFMDQEAF